jgi:signal transduction histidine kinase
LPQGLTVRPEPSGYTAPVAPDPLASFLEELPGPSCLLGPPDGRVAACNEGFLAWAGRDDVTGVSLGELLPGDEAVARVWEEARAASVAVEHHVERRGRAGGASFWSVRARRTRAGVLVWATDLSAFAEAAQAVHGAQRAYVAAAAHDLRAPLSAIKAWASALDARLRPHGEAPPLLDDGLGAIARQVDRMNELLSDLLEAARSDAGAVRSRRAPVAAQALVRGALEVSPHAARVTLDEAVEDRVLVDALQLETVLGHLLAYVARRRPEGPIGVTLQRCGPEVHLRIADAGPPLAPAAAADLFGRRALPGRGRGAGLGLHVAQLLATASGARLWREGDGDGARFVLALPGAAAAGPSAGRGRLRVLVAGREDGGLSAKAASVLRLFGHDVSTLAGADALDPGAVDLVLAEGPVPALPAVQAGTEAPVVILLAPAGERPPPLAGAERAGAAAVLPEPVDWTHLLALVHSVASARLGRA